MGVDDTKDEKGKPEAVNLEREEPISTAARRRDSFRADEHADPPSRSRSAKHGAAPVAAGHSPMTNYGNTGEKKKQGEQGQKGFGGPRGNLGKPRSNIEEEEE